MGAGDLQIQVWQRRLACVIEPTLVLARPDGPALALGLARAFEAWLTRAFWQVLDASELLDRAGAPGTDARLFSPHPRALAAWIELRDSMDGGSWTLRWLGDNVPESQLPPLRDAGPIELIEHYEALLQALQARLAQTPADRAAPGWRAPLNREEAAADALALSASLGGAMVLCVDGPGQRNGSDQGMPPTPVATLRRAGVPDTECPADDTGSLLAAERTVVRQALAAAGLAAPLQALPPLAAVHVLAEPDADGDSADPWAGAQAWWYRL